MEKTNLKPCMCGCGRLHMLHYKVWIFYYCRISCLSWDCDFSIWKGGLTKKQAERRARRAWNRRVGNG